MDNYDVPKKVADFIDQYSPVLTYSVMKYMFEGKDEELKELGIYDNIDDAEKERKANKFFAENFDKMNKAMYCFYVLYAYKYDRISTIERFKEAGYSDFQIQNFEKNCKKLLQKVQNSQNFKHVHYLAVVGENKDKELSFHITRASLKSLLNEKENRNLEKNNVILKNIQEKIPLEELFDIDSVDELRSFCKSGTLVDSIQNIIYVESYNETHSGKLSTQEITDLLDLGASKYKEFTLESIAKKRIIDSIKNCPDEFDVEKILLLSAYKAKQKLEATKWSDKNKEENIKLAKLLKLCNEQIKNSRRRVKISKDDEIIYSEKYLEDDVSRIAEDGYYVSSNEEKEIKESAESLLSQEASHLRVLEFNFSDISKMLNDSDVFEYLVNNNLISKNVKDEAIQSGKISQNEIVNLYNNGLIDNEELEVYINSIQNINNGLFAIIPDEKKLNTYMSGKSNFANMESLSDEEKQRLSKILKLEDLIKYYKSEDSEELFKKYSILYTTMVIGKDNADEIGEAVIDCFIDNDAFEEQDINKLYNANLITIGNILQICETENVADMLVDGTFRNDDIKRSCTEKERYDVFYNILKRDDLSWQNKVSIYRMSVSNLDISEFSVDKQERIKEYQKACERILNFDKAKPSVTPNPVNPNPRPPVNDRKTWNHYASDPQKRWDLFDSLGTYKYEILRNGVGIFKYEKLNVQPDESVEENNEQDTSKAVKGGPIIVESLFGDGEKPAYGKRTIVVHMDIEEFEKYEPELTSEGDIFTTISKHPVFQGKIDKFSHTKSWGDKLVDSLGFRTGKARSNEDLKKIEQIIEDVKKSREIFKYANE